MLKLLLPERKDQNRDIIGIGKINKIKGNKIKRQILLTFFPPFFPPEFKFKALGKVFRLG